MVLHCTATVVMTVSERHARHGHLHYGLTTDRGGALLNLAMRNHLPSLAFSQLQIQKLAAELLAA
jgi:hypothetical protein